jgi:uncharacterized protein YcbK (DUF882 family)
MGSTFIAPYISLEEYVCKHCGQLPFDFDRQHPAPAFVELFTAFAAIRTAWGAPIQINSGYRCETRNQQVGGENLSGHLFGLAFDLAVNSPEQLLALKNIIVSIKPMLRVGWKRYYETGQNLIHIDTAYRVFPRPTPKFIEGARW